MALETVTPGMRCCLPGDSPADTSPLTYPISHPTVSELTVLCCALNIPPGSLEFQKAASREWNNVVCPSHLSAPSASQKGLRRTHSQIFFHTSVHAVPCFLFPCLPRHLAPTHPTPEAFRDGTQHHLWALQLGTLLWSPSPHNPPSILSSLGSPVLSSRFIDGGTEVLREGAGSQGHRQGQRHCQDSNSYLSDSRALNF